MKTTMSALILAIALPVQAQDGSKQGKASKDTVWLVQVKGVKG